MVSIIVPVYNAEEYLSQCIDSLLAQTYTNLQIVLVNDGSRDRSGELCLRYSQADSRIAFLQQENMGVSAARNAGLRAAEGEFIAFVDADDWIDSSYIQTLVLAMTNTLCDCCICGYQMEFSDGRTVPRTLKKRCFESGDAAIAEMLSTFGFQGFLWNKLFRRELITAAALQLNERIFYYEDMLFAAEYFMRSKKIVCIDTTGYHYRQHSASAIQKTLQTDTQIMQRFTSLHALACIRQHNASSRVRRLCHARINMEYMIILRQLRYSHAAESFLDVCTSHMRKSFFSVWCSPISTREKAKYTLALLCPRIPL